jgi:putative sterol carrier protein
VDRPGDLDGPAADAALARILITMPFVIGKQVAPPEGSTVVFDLSPPLPGRAAVRMEGRARRLDEMPATPTVTVTTDGETFTRLACGRSDPASVLASGAVTFGGDAALGRRVVESLNFLF